MIASSVNRVSIAEIQRIISSINRLDPDSVPSTELERLYNYATEGLKIIIQNSFGHELFFRVRVISGQKPRKVQELGAPPASAVTGYQRCNGPSDPMFYSASKRSIAIRESRVKAGDVFYLSQWIGKVELPVNIVLHKIDETILNILEPEDIFLYSHFDTLFTRIIHSEFSNDYKFSAAVTNQITRNFQPSPNNNFSDDRTVGIRYPSIFDKNNSYNTAFCPGLATDQLDICHVSQILAFDAGGGKLGFHVVDNAESFQGQIINWSGSPSRLPLPRVDRKGVLFKKISDGILNLAVFENDPPLGTLEHLLDE